MDWSNVDKPIDTPKAPVTRSANSKTLQKTKDSTPAPQQQETPKPAEKTPGRGDPTPGPATRQQARKRDVKQQRKEEAKFRKNMPHLRTSR